MEKTSIFISSILFVLCLNVPVFADCLECCSYNGGAICNDRFAKCADETSLSTTCINRSCNVCPSTLPLSSESLQPITCNGSNYNVERIIDGDTFVLTNGETVRLIGIDTPEVGEPCYSEATQFLTNQIDGENICLSTDVSDTDRYDRWLRYAFTEENTFINRLLVIEGYAYAKEYPPDVKYAAHLSDAEDYASSNAVGCLWANSDSDGDGDSSGTGCFINIIANKR